MSKTMELIAVFELSTCSECGIGYGLPEHYRQTRCNDHKTFYCPNGHAQYIPAESEAERLKSQLDAERKTSAEMNRRREELQAQLLLEQKKVAAEQKKIKNMKRRAVAGTCQFCKRTFSDMEKHMHTKHEDEVQAASLSNA